MGCHIAPPLFNDTFNPLSEKWARQPDMLRGRWYPTLTRLSHNRVLITSGNDELGGEFRNTSVEVFTPDHNLDGSAGTIKAVGTVPASSSLVPAGYYMLFVLDTAGIPSVAKFVRVS